MESLFGGIEAGGTKFHCIVGTGPDDIRARLRVPTTAPEQTLAIVADFFSKYKIAAAGLACFGPIDIDRSSATFGNITNTPKKQWIHYNILGTLSTALRVPVGFHTDVVGAAMAEAKWGAGAGARGVLYITVGTGIGGGFVYDGKPIDGRLHAELGHIYIPRDPQDTYPGVCPYHGACLEGLASGPAIAARAGAPAESLAFDHEIWEIEARLLARAIVNFIFTLTPDIIILGGGVAHAPGLLPRVRRNVIQLIHQYGHFGEICNQMDQYLVAPALGDDAGALGGILLAMQRRDERPHAGI